MHFELQHAWLAEQSESKVHLWPKQLLLRKHFEWQHAWLAEQSESIKQLRLAQLLPNTHLFPQHINLSFWLAHSLSVRQKWLKQLSRRHTPSNQDPVPQQTPLPQSTSSEHPPIILTKINIQSKSAKSATIFIEETMTLRSLNITPFRLY